MARTCGHRFLKASLSFRSLGLREDATVEEVGVFRIRRAGLVLLCQSMEKGVRVRVLALVLEDHREDNLHSVELEVADPFRLLVIQMLYLLPDLAEV